MKKVYPVIFTLADDVILVEVPDLGIFTEGENMADAIEMARDAIGINGISREDHGEKIPEATAINDINLEKGTFSTEGRSIVSLIDIDFDIYRRKFDEKSLTIPADGIIILFVRIDSSVG